MPRNILHTVLSTICIVSGLFTMATATGCSAEVSEEDVESSGEAALTVQNGADYIDKVDDRSVTIKKSVHGADLRFSAIDFADKSVLIHPIPKKTETGVYARVERVDDRGDKLVLHTRKLQLEEMENTKGSDVIRLYRNTTLPVAPSSPKSLDDFGNLLRPAGVVPSVGRINPLSFSGPLATGELDPEVWVGTEKVYGSGQIHAHIASASAKFKPSAILEYKRGTGLTVGIRGDFTADLAIDADGWAEGHVVFFESPTLKTPRATFVVPIGLPPFIVPVPVMVGIDTYVECSALGAVSFEGTFKAHLGLHASASSTLNPSTSKPLDKWVTTGPWPNKVSADMSFDKTPESVIEGNAGIGCALPRVEFPISVAGLVGPYLAIHPEFAVTSSGFETAVDLYAGVDLGSENGAFFETLLLRWEPGNGG